MAKECSEFLPAAQNAWLYTYPPPRFLVRVSYLEIYKEEVRDLLSKNHAARLEVRERVDVGVYVKDLTSFVVKNPEEMDKLMFIGDKNSKGAGRGDYAII